MALLLLLHLLEDKQRVNFFSSVQGLRDMVLYSCMLILGQEFDLFELPTM
jgi:hypothetical protein